MNHSNSTSIHEWKNEIEHHQFIQVSGSDIDGISRGKLMEKNKFMKSLDDGFGFCSVIFGWDMHDKTYSTKVDVSNKDNGFSDIIAKIDTTTYRNRGQNTPPMFLLDFYNPKTNQPLDMCPRSTLKKFTQKLKALGLKANCGIEFEWYNLKETPDSLREKGGVGLVPLTHGMFGYSLLRPTLYDEFYNGILSECKLNGIHLEALHTETGPGVYEAAIKYTDALSLADQAHLFKTTVKQLGLKHGIISCFMAKPYQDEAGCSGHIHVSLANLETGKNLFAGEQGEKISELAKHFLAGLLKGLPYIMPLLAPTINSYKRLVENYFAPVNVTYGFENRTTAIRLIAPPSCPPAATRLELRVSGADCNPYLAIAGLLACGYEGIHQKLPLPFAHLEGDAASSLNKGERLPRNLREATLKMSEKDSFARQALGDGFVDHFTATRFHECDLYDRAVTNWELSRYMEVV